MGLGIIVLSQHRVGVTACNSGCPQAGGSHHCPSWAQGSAHQPALGVSGCRAVRKPGSIRGSMTSRQPWGSPSPLPTLPTHGPLTQTQTQSVGRGRGPRGGGTWAEPEPWGGAWPPPSSRLQVLSRLWRSAATWWRHEAEHAPLGHTCAAQVRACSGSAAAPVYA